MQCLTLGVSGGTYTVAKDRKTPVSTLSSPAKSLRGALRQADVPRIVNSGVFGGPGLSGGHATCTERVTLFEQQRLVSVLL